MNGLYPIIRRKRRPLLPVDEATPVAQVAAPVQPDLKPEPAVAAPVDAAVVASPAEPVEPAPVQEPPKKSKKREAKAG